MLSAESSSDLRLGRADERLRPPPRQRGFHSARVDRQGSRQDGPDVMGTILTPSAVERLWSSEDRMRILEMKGAPTPTGHPCDSRPPPSCPHRARETQTRGEQS
jgi:hypothetical protein